MTHYPKESKLSLPSWFPLSESLTTRSSEEAGSLFIICGCVSLYATGRVQKNHARVTFLNVEASFKPPKRVNNLNEKCDE